MKNTIATVALFLIGSLWFTIGKESGYTVIGILLFGVSTALVVALWNKKYAQFTRKIVIVFILVSAIAVILLPIINPPINKTSMTGEVAFKNGLKTTLLKSVTKQAA